MAIHVALGAAVSRSLGNLTPTQIKLALGAAAGAVAFACALVFVKLTESVWRGEEAVTLDYRVMRWILGHRPVPLTRFMRVVTDMAGPVVVTTVVLAVLVISLLRGRPRLGVFMVASTAGAALLVAAVKLAVGRPRPSTSDRLIDVTGAAFPSGHAAQSVACWVALAVVVAWALRNSWVAVGSLTLAALLAGLVGGSRVYLGVHWPSDVIAGWSLGLAWMGSLLAAFAVWDVAARNRTGTAKARQPGQHDRDR